MTTIRQRRANGANAKASTGPKTKAGKARSAQNALRHGLTISVWSEPALAPQAEAIALRIAGPNAEANALEWARRIGEAQVDLDRVGALRREAIIRMMSDSHKSLGDMQTTRHTFLNRLDCNVANHVGVEMIKQLTDPHLSRGISSWRGSCPWTTTTLRGSIDMNGERSQGAKWRFAALTHIVQSNSPE